MCIDNGIDKNIFLKKSNSIYSCSDFFGKSKQFDPFRSPWQKKGLEKGENPIYTKVGQQFN